MPEDHSVLSERDRAVCPDGVRILAVVACYEPDPQLLHALVAGLNGACDLRLLLVDNSESAAGRATVRQVADQHRAMFAPNEGNLGVAHALNIGLAKGFADGYSHVLFLDQDSALALGDVAVLARTFGELERAGRRVAAVGPLLLDARREMSFPFVRLGRVRMQRLALQGDVPLPCDVLISSGCLVALSVAREIGSMDERFFIDYVDFDWCVRARHAGYELYGVPSALMLHRLGERGARLRGKVIPVHVPVRQYYMTRNALLMLRKPGLSLRWRVHLVYRLCGQFAVFSLVGDRRRERWGWIMRGIVDGLLGVGGRCSGRHSQVAPRALAERGPAPHGALSSQSTERQ